MSELDELLHDAITAELAGRVHVALPARVISYDRTTQTASVQPILRGRYRAEDGTVDAYRLPVLTRVPVVFPQGGGFSITWDLAAGNTVQLVINERSTDEWKSAPADDIAPRDPRRFDLTDAVAIAGLSSPGAALVEYAANAMVIAAPATGTLLLGNNLASDFVALSSLVATEMGTQRTAVTTHMHPSPFGPIAAPNFPAPWPAVGSVACTKVKAK